MFVADYVLMEYGTGAIMAVPAHDERDFEFAQSHGLEVRRVIEGGDELPYAGDGPMTNSGRFDGVHNREAFDRIVEWLGAEGKGRAGRELPPARLARSRASATGAARSRSCTASAAGWSPVPDDQLPVELPGGRGLRAQGALAAGGGRGLGGDRLPAVRRRRPGARPTRWTPSSTPPGTSCATATRATTPRRGTARCSRAGCRWTSTSAAWSTRSCT